MLVGRARLTNALDDPAYAQPQDHRAAHIAARATGTAWERTPCTRRSGGGGRRCGPSVLLTDTKSMTGTVPANLPAAPIFKHPEQEDEAEGGVLVTIREDAPLDFRARACNKRLGVRGGRRTSGRRAGRARRNH